MKRARWRKLNSLMKTSIISSNAVPLLPVQALLPQNHSATPDPPAWTWFIENPAGPESPKEQLPPTRLSKFEPLDE